LFNLFCIIFGKKLINQNHIQMKSLCVLLIALLYMPVAYSQNTFKAIIKDKETKETLIGVTGILKETTIGSITDINGILSIVNIPDGKQIIEFTFIGYQNRFDTIEFPIASEKQFEIYLESNNEELEEVVVSSTRSSRTIADNPSRVEAILGEELDEKGNMKPGDIRMMLSESTGIQTQQTSATSYNSSIRIQGLDGKYTQIIRDGFPLYSGFSSGLGLLQIVPLDLKQVEVIKGSASTLYGGGAISGLVNLISKTPSEKRELNFLLNGTSALGLDASGFYSQKNKKIGTTVFASYNKSSPYDPSKTGLTAIPKADRYTFNPKLFIYFNDKSTLVIGFNGTIENRIGGDIKYIKGQSDSVHSYYEKNITNRYSTQLDFTNKITNNSKLNFKNSLSYYDRTIQTPGYKFSGIQLSSFSELNYFHSGKKAEWVIGINALTDKFNETKLDTTALRSYNQNTLGGFIQNTLNISQKIKLESGVRVDYHSEYGFFLLPRLSALYKINQKLTARLGGGLGYKTPTVFTEDAEKIQFKNVLPINTFNLKAEKSYGGNFDINYRSALFNDKVVFTINELLFYTRIDNPLILTPISSRFLEYHQPYGFIDTKGMETNIKISYSNFKLFVGYTLADVIQHYNGTKINFPLVARHRLNNVLMYEIENKLKIGLEAYYFSSQKLNDGKTGRDYWTTGFMIEKLWKHFSLFVNFENFLDTRQTKFDTIYTGSLTNPVFRDIYAPVDGFVINGGIKIKL
jgi:outer membrane receptor for ferrienterochelin and colicins